MNIEYYKGHAIDYSCGYFWIKNSSGNPVVFDTIQKAKKEIDTWEEYDEIN